MIHQIIAMEHDKKIALVAHDKKKQDLAEQNGCLVFHSRQLVFLRNFQTAGLYR